MLVVANVAELAVMVVVRTLALLSYFLVFRSSSSNRVSVRSGTEVVAGARPIEIVQAQ